MTEAIDLLLASRLENHELFIEGTLNNNKELNCQNMISYHKSTGLIVCEGKNLRVINLKKTLANKASSENTKDYCQIIPSIKIDFMIESIELNSTGKLLVVYNANNCHVIHIKTRVDIQNLNDIQCASREITFSHFDHTIIRKASWHPLSPSHLVILTSDNALRIFNLESVSTEPEQIYYLEPDCCEKYDQVRSYITSFSFGKSPMDDSWQSLTLYVMCNTGEIYGLCPILPYNAYVPTKILEGLIRRADRGDQKVVQWLKDITRGDKLFENVSAKKQTPTKRSGSVFNAPRSIGLDSESSEEESEEEFSSANYNGYSMIKNPGSRVPILQGPLNKPTQDFHNNSFFEASDISCLSTYPMVMSQVFVDGVVHSFMFLHDLIPKWHSHTEKNYIPKSLPYLIDQIDLELPLQSMFNNNPQFIKPYLSTNLQCDRIFVIHCSGVHELSFPAIRQIKEFLEEQPNKELNFGKITESYWHINTKPFFEPETVYAFEKITGFQIIVDPSLGEYLVVWEGMKKCHCLDLRLLGTILDPRKFQSDIKVTKDRNDVKDSIEILQGIELPNMTRQRNLDIDFKSEASLKIFGKFLIENHMLYYKHSLKLFEDMHSKLGNTKQTLHDDEATFASLMKMLNDVEIKNNKIKDRIAVALSKQESYNKRAETLLSIASSLQPYLTKAEIKWHKEMDHTEKVVLVSMINKVHQLEEFSNNKPNWRVPSNILTDKQIKNIQSVLNDLTKMISESETNIKYLQEDLSGLQPNI